MIRSGMRAPAAVLVSARNRPRLLASLAIGIAAGCLLPLDRTTTRLLLAWDIAIALYLVLVAVMIGKAGLGGLRERADEEDEGAAVILGLAMVAAVLSLVAIGLELREVKDAARDERATHLVLAGCTILFSWLFVHVMFALHYAHDFYAGEVDRRGLRFPGEEEPDYWDFLYFSFNLGAAAQTSDVAIEARRTRRLVLAHTVLSFLFNTTVLALAINVGAGLF